jgi:hypothetical protein
VKSKIEARGWKVVAVNLPGRDGDSADPLRTSFNHNYSDDVKTKVLENWKTYGFSVDPA